MSVRLSLLYPEGIRAKTALSPGEPDTGKIGPRTLYHFSLDSTFSKISEDDAMRRAFFSILALPCQKSHMVDYRQEILRVFAANPDFLYDFAELYDRFNGLKEGHDRERQAMLRAIHNSTAGASAQTLKNLLQANAITLKRCLQFVRALSDLCAKYRILSDDCKAVGLKRLAREVTALSSAPAFAQLTDLCTRFETMEVDAVLDFSVEIGEGGQISQCAMIEHKYLHIFDPEENSRKFRLFRRADNADDGNSVRIHMYEDTTYDKLVAIPLQILAEQIDAITDQLFETYCYIAPEMSFYIIACRYIEAMKLKGIPLCYPSVTEGADLSIRGLRDLMLVMDDETEAVIPNDIGGDDKRRGMIVFGENSSGKTVFLRSVGTAQILGQAGLPIPAEYAKLPICAQIVTQFSEAEKEFERGNDAGRFEQEVRELASVIDTLGVGAMVLLNETFQTTAYEEGAEGLLHILEYFSAHDIRFLLVSHLHQLEGKFDTQTVGVYRTQPGYKVCAD